VSPELVAGFLCFFAKARPRSGRNSFTTLNPILLAKVTRRCIQLSGSRWRLLTRAPPDSVESGALSFLGSVGKPVAMERVFPVVCFCIARQVLTNSMSGRKRAWQDASSPPWVKSFSLAGVPAAG